MSGAGGDIPEATGKRDNYGQSRQTIKAAELLYQSFTRLLTQTGVNFTSLHYYFLIH
jgi:hypothetical protein